MSAENLAAQLTQALQSISVNGTPFVLESLDLSSKAKGAAQNISKDPIVLLKELNEINRLLRAKSQQNRKLDTANEICSSLLTIDYSNSQEAVFEYVSLLEGNRKADAIASIIAAKQRDLPEIAIVKLLNLTLDSFANLKFGANQSIIQTSFVQSFLSEQTYVAGFALISAILTTSITKNALIKELRRSPVKQMIRLLEVLLILLKNVRVSSQGAENTFIASFEQVSEWVEVLLDAYYLNFCLKEEWKDLLEKIDEEIEQRSQLYESAKAFADSSKTYEKCKVNIHNAVNKIDSKFYVKSMYL